MIDCQRVPGGSHGSRTRPRASVRRPRRSSTRWSTSYVDAQACEHAGAPAPPELPGGLTEALSNAMLYGNAHDPSKRVRVEVTLSSGRHQRAGHRSGQRLRSPVRARSRPCPENLAKPGGRGLFLMRELLDEVSFNDRGNQVTLVLRLDAGARPRGRRSGMTPPDRLVPGTLPESGPPVARRASRHARRARSRSLVPPPEPGAAAEILYATDGVRTTCSRRVHALRSIQVAPRRRRSGARGRGRGGGRRGRRGGAARPDAGASPSRPAGRCGFFTVELSERYEEINLLYSIRETLGSILHMDDAARVILGEVCDVMGARRGSLWVYDRPRRRAPPRRRGR